MAKPNPPQRGKSGRRDIRNARLLHWCSFDGEPEIPKLTACDVIPPSLISFTDARARRKPDGSFIHFFQDDTKFECVWRSPQRYLRLLKAFGGALAPDFSLYKEMPLIEQAHSVFMSRVLAHCWSMNGVTVIPLARWGDKRSFKFCFLGLPKNSVIAVGTHGCVKHLDDRRYFMDGLFEMLARLEPKALVVYGSASDKLFLPLFSCGVEIVQFESDYSRSHKKRVV